MAKQIRRVGIAMDHALGLYYDFLTGILDYSNRSGTWVFDSRGHIPFKPFDQLDLAAVDGLIGLDFSGREGIDRLIASGLPAVIMPPNTEDARLPCVSDDDLAIGRVGAEHLCETGLTEFGFLYNPVLRSSLPRCAGFRQVIEAAGHSCHVMSIPYQQWPQRMQMIATWLTERPKPIGVMTDHDNLAVDLVNTALELGFRVPEQVAVLGADDDPWISSMAPISISSIALNTKRIGYLAAEFLDGLMDGKSPPLPPPMPPIGVVARQSTDVIQSEDPLVRRAIRYILASVEDGINVDDVLAKVAVSRPTLTKRMKTSIGLTPHQAICRARVEKAKQFLTHTDASLDAIARRCGFDNQSRLSEVFKRLVGMPPGKYRTTRGAQRNHLPLDPQV